MFKYFVTLICVPFTVTAQQTSVVNYAVPYLQIEDVHKKATNDTNDFGYNILIHSGDAFIKEGFYMWVDDQWYEILNSKELFTPYLDFKTLFTLSKDNQNPLKIKDVNDVVYLFPIEALDSYIVSTNDFNSLSKTIQKQSLITFIKPQDVVKIEENPIPKQESSTITDIPKLNANEPVLITSENSKSVLLDVMDVVEVVKREEVPYQSSPTSTETSEKEQEVVVAAKNTPIIAKPANDYEIAVNEGFDGTVTEWIESIDEKGGKSAYQQAVDKGYKGSEEEWMKMLWGREVDVEIAKRDKTTAIVSEWIQSLKTSNGSSPYELALKHGFYGTFTEWVESVIGTDGEKAYEHAQTKGFTGTYKEWIEEQLNNSNKEVLRKERLAKTQMFVAPNVIMPLNTTATEPLTIDLFD